MGIKLMIPNIIAEHSSQIATDSAAAIDLSMS